MAPFRCAEAHKRKCTLCAPQSEQPAQFIKNCWVLCFDFAIEPLLILIAYAIAIVLAVHNKRIAQHARSSDILTSRWFACNIDLKHINLQNEKARLAHTNRAHVRSTLSQLFIRQPKLPNATFVISLVLDVAERIARDRCEA